MIDFQGIVPYVDRHLLPEISGIYFVVDAGKIIYIGQSINISKRWMYSSHHRAIYLQTLDNPKIGWIFVPADRLDYEEDRFLKMFSPELNNAPVERDADKYPIVSTVETEQKDKLARVAEKNHRSMSKEVAHALSLYLEQFRDDGTPKPDAPPG